MVAPAVRNSIALSIAALLMLAGIGCSSVKNSTLQSNALNVPSERRDNVYAIFLNSQNDPLGMTNFRSIFKFAQECGFRNARYRHLSGGDELAAEIREIRRRDPDARISLICWSGASLYAFDAAAAVTRDPLQIDEIMYLDSDWIKEQRLNTMPHPFNVSRVVLCYSKQRTPPTNVPNPVVYQIPVDSHLDVPSHPRTSEIVINELVQLANRRSTRERY
jgi:hypothetical protein